MSRPSRPKDLREFVRDFRSLKNREITVSYAILRKVTQLIAIYYRKKLLTRAIRDI